MRAIIIFSTLLLGSFSSFSQKFPIQEAISVIFSERGFQHIQDNIVPILKKNGYNIKTFNIPEYSYSMPETKTEDLIKDKQIKEIIKKIKEDNNYILRGLNFESHKFKFDIDEISIKADWEEVKFVVDPDFNNATFFDDLGGENLFYAEFKLKANKINLSVAKVEGRDLTFDGVVDPLSVSHIEFETLPSGEKLFINVPMVFYKRGRSLVGVNILETQTNIGDVGLAFVKPEKIAIDIPHIELNLNKSDQFKVELNTDAAEEKILEMKDDILANLQQQIEDNFNSILPDVLNEVLNDYLDGDLKIISTMAPPGTPDGEEEKVKKMAWGIKSTYLGFKDKNFHLDFNGMVFDPLHKVELPELAKENIGLGGMSNGVSKIKNYDLTFALNISLFNRFLQSGYRRGYYNDVDISEDAEKEDSSKKKTPDLLVLTESPLLVVDKDGQLKMKMKAQYEYKDGGIQGLFVKNPINLELVFFVHFEITFEGKITFKIRDIDMENVVVDRDSFKWPFKGKGVNTAMGKIEEGRKAARGYVLTEEIPMEDNLMGIQLVNKAVSIDKNGYILIHTNYQKSSKGEE